MGGLSIWHLMILGLVVFVFFGKGRISDLMEDVGKGIKSFKKGISDDEPAPLKPVSQIDAQAAPVAPQIMQPVTPPSETH
jgi:sec-independent protein translocase protein TatA